MERVKLGKRKFYVYEHWRPDTNQCFYVGKGGGFRAFSITRERNPFHANIVRKLERLGLEVEVRIFSCGLSNAEALRTEIERIAFWKSYGFELTNATNGGEGMCGYSPSIETRKKLGIASSATPRTPEWKARISASVKASWSQRTGKPRGGVIRHSAETRKKMSEAKKGRKMSAEQKAKIKETMREAWRSGRHPRARINMNSIVVQ